MKLNDSFPIGQFKIPGNTAPSQVDSDRNGGGIMFFKKRFYSNEAVIYCR